MTHHLPKKYASFADPLDGLIIDDDDALSVIVLALDAVATLIAAHPRWASLPDVETEPLESLLERANGFIGNDDGQIASLVENAENLALLGRAVRYQGADIKDIVRAESLRQNLIVMLKWLETELE